MVGLKVNLPHLSLSRPSSKSRKGQERNSSQPPTPSTAPPTVHSSQASISSSSGGGSPPQGSTAPSSIEGGSISPLLAPTPANGPDRLKGERRASLGAIGAALRRTVTASTPITSPTISPVPSGTNTPRTTSDGGPAPAPLPPPATKTSPVIGAGKMGPPPPRSLKRSPKSGALPLASAVSATQIGHSQSQPALSRLGALGNSLRTGGKASPAVTPHVHGSQTPVGVAPARAPSVPALEESYVAKVSQRLGEAINRVFLPASHSGVSAADLMVAGRMAPRVERAKDAADMVLNELAAALPDHYLLKVIIRSSVLKSLSLFLTRLSALLLSTPPLDLPVPAVLPAPIKLNLAVVRAAHLMASGLREAGKLHGAPSFVAETLNPWAVKMEEVMSRVMTPILTSVRAEVVRITLPAQLAPASMLDGAKLAAHGTATPTLAAKAHMPTASQIRSLSLPLSRSASPAPAAFAGPAWLAELGAVVDSFGRLVKGMECGVAGDRWLVSVGTCAVWKAMLSLSARAIDSDSTSPVVAASVPVGKAALFAASAKLKAGQVGTPPPSPPPRVVELHAQPASRASSHSRALSPGRGVSPARGGRAMSPRERALAKVVAELECLEGRMQAYVGYLSGPLAPPAPWTEACASGACELCRTGRGFDPESATDEEEGLPAHGLAQEAMREALQSLSAMVVVCMASGKGELMREALEADATGAVAARDGRQADAQPLTPGVMLGMSGDLQAPPAPATDPSGPRSCPTLLAALPELPPLLLLHLVAARLPPSLGFKPPHALFGLAFEQYASELRGFAQGEEWEGEVGWEVGAEVARVRKERAERGAGLSDKEAEGLEVVEWAVKGVDGQA